MSAFLYGSSPTSQVSIILFASVNLLAYFRRNIVPSIFRCEEIVINFRCVSSGFIEDSFERGSIIVLRRRRRHLWGGGFFIVIFESRNALSFWGSCFTLCKLSFMQ